MIDEVKAIADVRDYREGDLAFIKATFLRGIYYGFNDDSKSGVGWFGSIPKDLFMFNYSKVADALLKVAVVKVISLKEDPDTILGYSILSADFQTVHYVYVKKTWRMKGLGRSLVPALFTQATHLTAVGKTLMNKFPNAVFNPFAI